MPEFKHPEDFDLMLKTTPYFLWMWLKKETKYQSTDKKNIESDPTLSPPIIDLRERHWGHKKNMFTLSRNIRTPLPSDKHAYFLMIGKGYPDWDAPADYWNSIKSDPDDPDSEVIRIDMEKVDNNYTRVIGDYNSKFPEFGKYMNQIRDQMLKEFSEVVRDQIPGEIIADKRGKKESVLETAENKVAVKSKPLPKWWPIKESTKHKWKRKYKRMENEIDYGHSNIWLAKKYHRDRKTIGHIIKWATSDPDFDSY